MGRFGKPKLSPSLISMEILENKNIFFCNGIFCFSSMAWTQQTPIRTDNEARSGEWRSELMMYKSIFHHSLPAIKMIMIVCAGISGCGRLQLQMMSAGHRLNIRISDSLGPSKANRITQKNGKMTKEKFQPGGLPRSSLVGRASRIQLNHIIRLMANDVSRYISFRIEALSRGTTVLGSDPPAPLYRDQSMPKSPLLFNYFSTDS